MRKLLVFRHGILLNRYFMLPMERYFRRKGYEVYNSTYPTTKKFVEEHARDLSEELMDLARRAGKSVEPYEISIITHSLGGLVLRYALTHFEMPPIHRAVLFVPPSRGSAAARYFKNWLLYRKVFGAKAGSQLAEAPPGIYGAAGSPDGVDAAIIAGSVGWKILPPKLEKPHDGVVTFSEACLPPLPIKVLPYGHTPILFVRYAWEEAECYLRNGRFREDSPSTRSACRKMTGPAAGPRLLDSS